MWKCMLCLIQLQLICIWCKTWFCPSQIFLGLRVLKNNDLNVTGDVKSNNSFPFFFKFQCSKYYSTGLQSRGWNWDEVNEEEQRECLRLPRGRLDWKWGGTPQCEWWVRSLLPKILEHLSMLQSESRYLNTCAISSGFQQSLKTEYWDLSIRLMMVWKVTHTVLWLDSPLSHSTPSKASLGQRD